MAFSESIKKEAKKRSHYKCCICGEPFLEVHHIKPQKDGGPDTLENAAPLCHGCHARYGGNPDFRKQIKEMRDFQWDTNRKKTEDPDIKRLSDQLDLISRSQRDMSDKFGEFKEAFINYHRSAAERLQSIHTYTELSAATGITLWKPELTKCPNCGEPLHETGPRPSEFGLVMFYRCDKCSKSYPGQEEWEG